MLQGQEPPHLVLLLWQQGLLVQLQHPVLLLLPLP
jgi:hypothetical protein